MITRSYPTGSIVSIRGPQGGTVIIRAPDGMELHLPAASGHARLWLAQTGTWTYDWADTPDAGGEIIAVTEETPATVERAATHIEAA